MNSYFITEHTLNEANPMHKIINSRPWFVIIEKIFSLSHVIDNELYVLNKKLIMEKIYFAWKTITNL